MAGRLEAFAAAELAAQHVVDAYLVDVELGADGPVPRRFRERFKTLGPSNRPDLGKQGATAFTPGGAPEQYTAMTSSTSATTVAKAI